MNLGTDIEEIAATLNDHVLTIAMQRPAKKNALVAAMYLRMAELIVNAQASPSVRVIVITGTRDCFSSGNDVSSFAVPTDGDVDATPPLRFLNALVQCELPVVAAVNGPAIGVGTTLLLHCDFVIAGQDATFQTPFVKLAVCPEAASSYTMPLRMGYFRAAEMLLLGETYTATQALACNLVSAVHPVSEYQQRAQALASRLAQQPPGSVRATKKLLRAPVRKAIEDAMQFENREFAACMASPEFAEAINAFLQRRPA